MAIYLKSPYIIYQLTPARYIPSPTIINHLKITQSSTQTKIKPFYCSKFVIARVKGLRLVRDILDYTTEFSKNIFLETFLLLFHKKKTKQKHQKSKETCHWKLFFDIWSYSTWTSRYAKAREQVRHVSTWARKTRWHPQFIKNTTPSFLPSPPLNLQTVQVLQF